ncbi:hypothetical protein CC80DRAFT_494230 [Byssothecium circinans]|uniref:Uncharacterized protein n=1 Tax=Byssothecium circinans TaxID=147558 RepID=A0A6A5TQJ8_9PLEO|nr:hypothetical protein CC80DRAFT_494230 [Byssothecium circinans]
MQFSVVAIVAFAAVSSASYTNGTIAYPSGTGAGTAAPTGAQPSSTIPFNNAAPVATGAGSAFAVLAAGAAALLI